MGRTVAELPPGARITDYIGLGVITKTFPDSAIGAVLARTGKASVRHRDLPAQVVVYYVIALALYMQSSYREVLRCLLEGVQWLRDPSAGVRVAGKSGISQARTRLGWEPLRQLHDELVRPIAVRSTRGAWYRSRLLVSSARRQDRAAQQNPRSGAPGVLRPHDGPPVRLRSGQAFAIRGLMHEAALKADQDPDRLSFLHAVRVVRRKLHLYGAIPPSAEEEIS